MDYDVRLEQVDSHPLAIVRRRARLPELSTVIPDACGVVWNVIRLERVAGARRNIAVYLDDVMNLEVGVELEGPFAGSGEVVGSATPAGLVATTTHFGPYALLVKAHNAIQQWCESNGKKLAGPSWEIYGNWEDEWNKSPSLIRTDVSYLLEAERN